MCGIGAVIGPDTSAELLLRMHASIRHRGPDGEGFLSVTRAGSATRHLDGDALLRETATNPPVAALAFRWLKIQDITEAARQPMVSEDGAVWIALNGEIYNFRELAAELSARGHAFHTHSDTEVALAAFLEWGTDCFARFIGMWSIVLIDTRNRRAIVSRDRFGIKPLAFTVQGRALLIASEARQIACSGNSAPEPDLDSIARFATGSPQLHCRTFFRGVETFPPGCYAVVDFDAPRIEPRPYWRLADALTTAVDWTFDDAARRLDELLTSSVRMQLIAEVGVGTLLSGGLDSSLVTVLASRADSVRRPAFSFVLNERIDKRLDESQYIDDVVQATGVPSYKTTMDGAWVRDNMTRVTLAQEAPVTGAPVMAQFRTHELAASMGVRVVLDGQGSDETFGGYIRHQALLLNDLLLQGHGITFARELNAFRRAGRHYGLTYLRQGIASPLLRPFIPRRAPAWFLGAVEDRNQRPEHLPRTSRLSRALYRDVTELNLPNVLGITDHNSMAHSLEARVPFLDHRIVELAFALPAAFKVGEGMRKRILRTLALRYVPPSVSARTDSIGFGTPQGRWMRNELRASIESAALDGVFQRDPLFDGAAARRLIKRYYEGNRAPADERQVWTLFALHSWYQAFGIRG
jgi:asparagine synthase (glutamine-hydrolysing)